MIRPGDRVRATFLRWDLDARRQVRRTEEATVVPWPNARDGYLRVRLADGNELALPLEYVEPMESR